MPITSRIAALGTAFPEGRLSNEELADRFENWTADKIRLKLGIASRRVLSGDETPSDIAVQAARDLFARHAIEPSSVDYLLYCTQAPDYLLPTTACLIHERLGLGSSAGAVDINQGCSGYIHALALAKGLIESGVAARVLVLTADGYSRYVGEDDASVSTLFGDGATATLLDAVDPADPPAGAGEAAARPAVEHFVFGTDGAGAGQLILRNSAFRRDGDGGPDALHMDGPGVLQFTLREVPRLKDRILALAGLGIDEVDHVILHQANRFLLERLEKKLGLPAGKSLVDMEDVGNTVSSTIPIVLARAVEAGRVRRGQRLLLAGFGVGLSWGGCLLTY